jgi:octaprenyl-diphosphate synthase
MLTLQTIQEPIAEELQIFETKFRGQMRSKVFLLDKITNYIVKRKGKQVRPMFIFLSSHLCGGVNENTYIGAGLIELLHTATLVHDDVVDDSFYRRGFFSINALWKNKIAVLVGDYLLSRGLLLAVESNNFELLKIVSEAVRDMSEGELLQIEKARRLDITEDVYFEIIRQKTASLISSCCAVGAHAGGGSRDQIALLKQFGMYAGIAFQIKDDLFDYGSDEIGKPTGIDIKEKKMTLPLIYALSKAGYLEKERIKFIVKNQSHKSKKVREVIAWVRASGGIEYATQKMHDYKQRAFEILNHFEPSPYRKALSDLLTFTIERKK